MRLVCWLLAGLLALHAVVLAIDLVQFFQDPSLYPIGSEAAGLRYGSAATYVGISVLELLLDAVGLAVAASPGGSNRRIVWILVVLALQCAVTIVLYPSE